MAGDFNVLYFTDCTVHTVLTVAGDMAKQGDKETLKRGSCLTCVVCIDNCAVCIDNCAVYSGSCAVCSVSCAECSVLCKLFSV